MIASVVAHRADSTNAEMELFGQFGITVFLFNDPLVDQVHIKQGPGRFARIRAGWLLDACCGGHTRTPGKSFGDARAGTRRHSVSLQLRHLEQSVPKSLPLGGFFKFPLDFGEDGAAPIADHGGQLVSRALKALLRPSLYGSSAEELACLPLDSVGAPDTFPPQF